MSIKKLYCCDGCGAEKPMEPDQEPVNWVGFYFIIPGVVGHRTGLLCPECVPNAAQLAISEQRKEVAQKGVIPLLQRLFGRTQ